MFIAAKKTHLCLSTSIVFLCFAAHAQSLPDPSIELRRQQEQLQELRQKLEPSNDTRLQGDVTRPAKTLPRDERPCFVINRVHIESLLPEFSRIPSALAGPLGDDAPVGKCLGAQGIQILVDRLQNELIAQGYITTRVNAPAQDLKSGTLTLSVLAGRLGKVRFVERDPQPPQEQNAATQNPKIYRTQTSLRTAMPARAGDIVNLRDIEQALENLRQLPSAEAEIQIVPSDQEGHSDILIRYTQTRPLRFAFSLDDSGSPATGKLQSSSTVSYDNPLGLNDMLYLSLQRDLGRGDDGERGTRGAVLHYTLPLGYWRMSATANTSTYHQDIVGAFQTYNFHGKNANHEIQLERIVQRNAVGKTSLSLKAFARRSSNFIDDTEVLVQRRRTGGWEFEASHRHFFGASVLDMRLSQRRGTGAFGAIAAPEELFDEGTARMKLANLRVNLDTPFTLAKHNFRWSSQLRIQSSSTRLTPQDRLCLGGRYSVRGTDGQQSLCADDGKTLRNEVSTLLGKPTPSFALQAYAGLDLGQVTNSRPRHERLRGVFMGLRSNTGPIALDVYVATPVHKPDGFETAGSTYGFSLNATF